MTFLTAADYTPAQTELVRATTLTVATLLGDYMEEMVVVGGLVPSLLIPAMALPAGVEAHPGTMDLDLGLDLAILDERRYEGIAERLRSSGFRPDQNERGNDTRQRWVHAANPHIKVDFLIPPVGANATPGRLQSLDSGLAAIIIPGLEVAFRNRIMVNIAGKTLFGETASRDIPVCNPGAFVLLKALAFRNRGLFKDAYDLYYMVRNYGDRKKDVAVFLKPLVESEAGQRAVAILQEDFLEERALGPMRVARFATGAENTEIQADVVGFVSELLREVAG